MSARSSKREAARPEQRVTDKPPEKEKGLESCAERVSGTLDAVRKAMMAVDNTMEQDACYETWEEACWSVGELEYAVEQLRTKVSDESRRAEER